VEAVRRGWKLTVWGVEWGQIALATWRYLPIHTQPRLASRKGLQHTTKGARKGRPLSRLLSQKLEDEFAPESEALVSRLTGIRYIEEG